MSAGRLGRVCSRHRISNVRPTVFGLVFFGAGIAIFAILIVLNASSPSSLSPRDAVIYTDLNGNSTGYAPGSSGLGPILVPFGLLALMIGAINLVKVLRWGPGAYLGVHEHGLVWGSRWRSRNRTWDQVRWLSLPAEIGKTRKQSDCLVVFDDGTWLSYGNSTHDHATVTQALREHCRTVPPVPVEQRPAYRWRFAWLAGGVLSLAGVGWMAWYVSTLSDDASDGTVNTVSAATLILVIFSIVGFSGFATVRRR